MSEATFKPNKEMAAAASRGLKLREKFGRGGTDVGVRRAQQLVDGADLDEADVKSMHSYFARHAVDKDGAAESGPSFSTAISSGASFPGA